MNDSIFKIKFKLHSFATLNSAAQVACKVHLCPRICRCVCVCVCVWARIKVTCPLFFLSSICSFQMTSKHLNLLVTYIYHLAACLFISFHSVNVYIQKFINNTILLFACNVYVRRLGSRRPCASFSSTLFAHLIYDIYICLCLVKYNRLSVEQHNYIILQVIV